DLMAEDPFTLMRMRPSDDVDVRPAHPGGYHRQPDLARPGLGWFWHIPQLSAAGQLDQSPHRHSHPVMIRRAVSTTPTSSTVGGSCSDVRTVTSKMPDG